MARAIATRCCMPPESCHGWLRAACAQPDRVERVGDQLVAVARGRASCAAAEARRCRVPSATGRGCGRTPGTPRPSAGLGPVTGAPSISTTPLVGRSRPARHFSSVVLPQPGRPDDADELAGVHREADVPDRLDVARRRTRRPCAGAPPAAGCSDQARSTSLIPWYQRRTRRSTSPKSDGEEDADEAEQEDAAPHLGDEVVALEVGDPVAEARRRGEHLGDDHQDQRDRERLPDPGHDARAGGREHQEPQPLPPGDPERVARSPS